MWNSVIHWLTFTIFRDWRTGSRVNCGWLRVVVFEASAMVNLPRWLQLGDYCSQPLLQRLPLCRTVQGEHDWFVFFSLDVAYWKTLTQVYAIVLSIFQCNKIRHRACGTHTSSHVFVCWNGLFNVRPVVGANIEQLNRRTDKWVIGRTTKGGRLQLYTHVAVNECRTSFLN